MLNDRSLTAHPLCLGDLNQIELKYSHIRPSNPQGKSRPCNIRFLSKTHRSYLHSFCRWIAQSHRQRHHRKRGDRSTQKHPQRSVQARETSRN
jgi:hypothetical protein